MSNGSLVITRVDVKDVGAYHCVGSSADGRTQTFTTELTIAC